MHGRFRLVPVSILESCGIQDTAQDIPTFYNDLGSPLAVEPLVKLLNEQDETIRVQEQRIRILQQEIEDTCRILCMQSERLKGWCDR